MTGDDDVSAIIEQDKQKNPNCHYSQTHSSSCRSTNGQSVCEVLTRITRMCPGQRPIDIYSNSSTTENSNSSSVGTQPRVADPFFERQQQQDPLAIFDSLFREFSQGFGGFQQPPARYQQRPSPFGRAPDRPAFDQQFPRYGGHRDDDDDNDDDGSNGLARGGPHGHASGPIERI
jgi:hypothetical protein